MKKIKDVFEAECFCFDFNDICKSRFKKLRPEHRKMLYFAKLEFFKCMEARIKGDHKKAQMHLERQLELETGEWTKQYDFDVGIELVDEWRDWI